MQCFGLSGSWVQDPEGWVVGFSCHLESMFYVFVPIGSNGIKGLGNRNWPTLGYRASALPNGAQVARVYKSMIIQDSLYACQR